MKSNKAAVFGAVLIALISLLSTRWTTAETDNSQKIQDDIRYLLIFRALPPHQKKERNFYELARDIKGFIDGRFFPPTAVITDEEIRYNVLKIIKTKVLQTTDSQRSPRSLKNSRYVLAYNSLYRLCALNYAIEMKGPEKGSIHYSDCESGHKHQFPIITRQPFAIMEVEYLTDNILRQIWEMQKAR